MSPGRLPARPASVSSTYSRLAVYGSIIFLLIAITASIMMAARHIWAIALPGCGQGGGCDWAVRSQYGIVFGWPTPFIGIGFFTSLLLLFGLTVRAGRPRLLLYLARLGILVSLALIVVMLSEGHFCVWCITTHASNLGWWLCLEFGLKSRPDVRRLPWKDVALCALTFLVLAVSCKALAYREKLVTQSAAHEAALESLARIGQTAPATPDSSASLPEHQMAPVSATSTHAPARFGGRYWTGSAAATVRVVMFHDYECQLCKEVDSILAGLLRTRNDLSVSVKQWPFDKECNPNIVADNIHPGACLAARCAEAAGLIGGDSAFWNVHRWLVERDGKVTLAEAAGESVRLGLDRVRFQQALNDPRIDSAIHADIQEGLKYGIKFTPMIFVNGYEVQGWQSAGAIPAAIERAAQVAKSRPKRDDLPDPAVDREFQEWLTKPMTTIHIRQNDHLRGPISAPTAVLMFADISDPYTAVVYKQLAPLMQDSSKVCFIFRVFPLQADCNSMVKRPINPRACEVARVLEASAVAGGEPAFRKAFRWLLDHSGNLPPDLVTAIADVCGLDRATLGRSLQDARVEAQISANVEAAKQLGVNSSPSLFINGKNVPNWRTPGLLQRIISRTSGTSK